MEWTRLLGGTSDDLGNDIVTDSSGNVFITGQASSGTLDGNNNSGTTGFDIVTAKYSSNGTLLWTRLLGGPSNEVGTGIAVDNNSNVYITGYSSSNHLDGNDNAGSAGFDIVVAKYAKNGTLLWTRLLGGSSDDVGEGIVVDNGDNIYIVGHSKSDFLDGNINAGSGGTTDVVVAKYATNGTRLWTRFLGGVSGDWGLGISTDGSGNVYITGYSNNNSLDENTNAASAGTYDILVAKYASNGTRLWTRLLGGALDDVGQSIATDKNDFVYITGYSNSVEIEISLTSSKLAHVSCS